MYLITPTLLNSWNYIFKAQGDRADEAYEQFVSMLKREKFEPNKYMLEGIEFEKKCIQGEVDGISEIIENGAFQVSGSKPITVDKTDYLLYGRIDVLKSGVIYDIKKNQKYSVGKYFDSYQHHIYMELIPEAKKFVYLIGTNASKAKKQETGREYDIFTEVYDRDECNDLENAIRFFTNWLEMNGLLEIYKKNWEAKRYD